MPGAYLGDEGKSLPSNAQVNIWLLGRGFPPYPKYFCSRRPHGRSNHRGMPHSVSGYTTSQQYQFSYIFLDTPSSYCLASIAAAPMYGFTIWDVIEVVIDWFSPL
jgi:hypothetical protein